MAQKHTLICMALPAWEGDYAKSTVELMSAMAAQHKVYYVDYPYTWKDVWNAIIGKKKQVPLARIFNPINRVVIKKTRQGSSIRLVTLWPFIPANGIRDKRLYRWLMRFNAGMALKTLKNILQKEQIGELDVINAFQPALGNQLIGKLGEKGHYYYCYDEISAAKWAGRHGNEEERLFLPKVKAVIVSSHALYEAKSLFNPETYLIKNGVDFQLFHSGYQQKTKKNGSVIGYIGSIDDRLDYSLIRKLIQIDPSWKLIMIGRVVSQEIHDLAAEFSQIELKGSFPPEMLPQQMSGMDLAIIPFVKNDFTRNIYPLKINEYLAAGIPVVSTHFSHLEDFISVAQICDTHQDFMTAVKTSIYNNVHHNPDKGWAFAKANDWANRADQLTKLLENHAV